MKVAKPIRQLFSTVALIPLLSAAAHSEPSDVQLFLEGGLVDGRGDIAYAQFYDTVDNYPFEVSPGSGWTGQAGLAADLDSTLDVMIAYRQSNTSNDADTDTFNDTNSNADHPVWNVLGLDDNTFTPGATSYHQATVETEVRAQMLDFLVGYDVGLGQAEGEFKILAGVRYLRLDQDTSMELWCDREANCASPQLELTQSRDSRFEGAGPQIGAGFSTPLNGPNLTITGSIIGAVIFGEQETETYSIWYDGSGENTATYSDKHRAYSLDGRLGLSYAPNLFPGAMEFGYRFSYLANVRDSRNEEAASADDIFGSRSDDYFEHGPFIRLTFSLL